MDSGTLAGLTDGLRESLPDGVRRKLERRAGMVAPGVERGQARADLAMWAMEQAGRATGEVERDAYLRIATTAVPSVSSPPAASTAPTVSTARAEEAHGVPVPAEPHISAARDTSAVPAEVVQVAHRPPLRDRVPPTDPSAELLRERADRGDLGHGPDHDPDAPARNRMPPGIYDGMVLLTLRDGRRFMIDPEAAVAVARAHDGEDYPLPGAPPKEALGAWIAKHGAPPDRAAATRLLERYGRRLPLAEQVQIAMEGRVVKRFSAPLWIRDGGGELLGPHGGLVSADPLRGYALLGAVDLAVA